LLFIIYESNIYIKKQADVLSKKPGYKEKQKLKDSFIFRKYGDDLILNKQ
jgi:hypothetical protein